MRRGSRRPSARGRCGPTAARSRPTAVCGFVEGMRVVLLEPSGAHDFLTVEAVAGADVELSYRGPLSSTYAARHGRAGARRRPHLRAPPRSRHRHPAADALRRLPDRTAGGGSRGGPVVRVPRRARAAAAAAGGGPGRDAGPWTTYGPAPPPVGVDDASTGVERRARTACSGSPTAGTSRVSPSLGRPATWCRFDAGPLRRRALVPRRRRRPAASTPTCCACVRFGSACAPKPRRERCAARRAPSSSRAGVGLARGSDLAAGSGSGARHRAAQPRDGPMRRGHDAGAPSPMAAQAGRRSCVALERWACPSRWALACWL